MLSNHPNVMGGNGGGVSSTVIGGIGLFANGTAAAPSISFLSDPNTGFYNYAADSIGVSNGGTTSWVFHGNGRLYTAGGSGYIYGVSGALGLYAEGTNQNITLTPSGTGGVFVGAFQAGLAGYVFGVRPTTNVNFLITNSGANLYVGALNDAGSGYVSGIFDLGATTTFKNSGGVTLTLDSALNAVFGGTIKPILATTAGAPAYVKGAVYFDTTLNKLRVGGASAWETITSA